MKEIRLHGRGGQGVVKAAQTIVSTVVDEGAYAQFIPFFGVERKGSPVFGFLRVDSKPIRQKCQVYKPEIVIIFDDSLLKLPKTFLGMTDGATVIINTSKAPDELDLPSNIGRLATVDASRIAVGGLGVNIPNTAMLGAFCRVTGIVGIETMLRHVGDTFGAKNVPLAREAYDTAEIIMIGGVK